MKNKRLITNKLRYVFYTLLTCVLCIGCESKTSTPNGTDGEKVISGSATYYSVSAVDYYSGGMHYKVFYSGAGDVFVVNITRDSLSVANAR